MSEARREGLAGPCVGRTPPSGAQLPPLRQERATCMRLSALPTCSGGRGGPGALRLAAESSGLTSLPGPGQILATSPAAGREAQGLRQTRNPGPPSVRPAAA